VERYLDLDPVQFNYSLLTRSSADFSHENLRLRDPEWLASAERWFQTQAGVPADAPLRAPMFAPFRLRDMDLVNRDRGVAHGAVQGGGRLPDRLAPRASTASAPRAARGWSIPR
jgi:hypothetical protein